MTNTSNNKALIFLIIVLLLTNIAVLAYFLWPKHEDKAIAERNRYKLIEPLKSEVGFSDSQITEYKKIKDGRAAKMKRNLENLRRVRDSFYHLLSTGNQTDSLLNIYSDSIAYRQKLLDLETFAHFKQLRMLCTPEQQAKYDSMVQRIVHRWGSPIRNKDPKK